MKPEGELLEAEEPLGGKEKDAASAPSEPMLAALLALSSSVMYSMSPCLGNRYTPNISKPLTHARSMVHLDFVPDKLVLGPSKMQEAFQFQNLGSR